VLSPARPGYGQEAIISIRGFRYAMLAQARGEKGEGPPAAVVNITRRALAGLGRIRRSGINLYPVRERTSEQRTHSS
jgi:hypothetical protein